jgi:acetyl-CoA carboxylase carboxyl transferase subunit beta
MNTKVSFTLISQDDKIILLQEGGLLAYGLWSIPGGHVDPGESFEQAAIREAAEESGYQITIEKEIYSTTITNQEYKGSKGDTPQVDIKIFKAKIAGGTLCQDDQALSIGWFNKEDIQNLPLRWPFLKKVIKDN